MATKKGLLFGHVPPQSITCGGLWCDLTIQHEKLELFPSGRPHPLHGLLPIHLVDKGKRLPGGRMAEMRPILPRKREHVVTLDDRLIFRSLDIFPPPLCRLLYYWSFERLRMNGCQRVFQRVFKDWHKGKLLFAWDEEKKPTRHIIDFSSRLRYLLIWGLSEVIRAIVPADFPQSRQDPVHCSPVNCWLINSYGLRSGSGCRTI